VGKETGQGVRRELMQGGQPSTNEVHSGECSSGSRVRGGVDDGSHSAHNRLSKVPVTGGAGVQVGMHGRLHTVAGAPGTQVGICMGGYILSLAPLAFR